MINLDLSLLDLEKTRKEKRKHLLRLCALPVALLLVISLFFLSSWIYNLVYMVAYSKDNYIIAHDFTETRFLMNILEPYIPDYNQGVIYIKTDEFEKAENSFRKSLENNPPESRLCLIYENLSLSIEKQGDKARANGHFGEAIDFYTSAETVLYASGCAGQNGQDGKTYNADVARDRIKESKKQAINEMNNTPDDADSILDPAREKEITEKDLKENEENNVTPNNVSDLDLLFNNEEKFCDFRKGDLCW